MNWPSQWMTTYFVALGGFCLAIGLMSPCVNVRPVSSSSTITDMAGREINLGMSVQRMAILAPVLSAYAGIDAGLEHVIAVSRFVQNFESMGTFGHIFPQLKSLPLAGTNIAIPDPELILLLQPQAVIAWNGQSEVLASTGYPGLVELKNPSRESIIEMWTLLGKVAGRENRATELLADAKTKQQYLRNMLPQLPEVPHVLSIAPVGVGWWFGGRLYNLNALLEYVGAINPAREMTYYGAADPERILEFNPDYILMPSEMDQATTSKIYDDPQWQSLRAVRQRRVYLTPFNSRNNIPLNEPLLLVWLAELVHPSLPHLTRAVYRETYAQFYQYDLSDDEIDAALLLKENTGSTGYERFARDHDEKHTPQTP